jgi:NAD+ kinase
MGQLKILLRPNFERENTAQVLREAITGLLGLGAAPMLSGRDAAALGGADTRGCIVGGDDSLLAACDILMAVGGDGTVLRAAGDAIRAGKPLVGVNTGRVGFLTQLEPGELDLLSQLVAGDYKLYEPMLLEALVTEEGRQASYTALNDIVIRREDTNRILTIDVHDGESLVMRQRADGIIFATPTGSTAYSLSAGGPVVSPELSAVILTPICPYGISGASLVLPPGHTYTVTEQGGQHCGFTLAVDGQHYGCHHRIEITRSPCGIRLIDLGHRGFYDNMNGKLMNC